MINLIMKYCVYTQFFLCVTSLIILGIHEYMLPDYAKKARKLADLALLLNLVVLALVGTLTIIRHLIS